MTNFGELLSEFHDAYSQYGRERFYLSALTQQEHKEAVELDRLVSDDEGAVLGYVDIRAADSPLRYVSSGANDLNAWHICVLSAWPKQIEKPDWFDAPFSLYRRLACASGARLQRSVRDSYQCSAGEPVSTWLNLLWHLYPPADSDFFSLSVAKTNIRMIAEHPFRQSADAIETCALHTPNPVFRRQHETAPPPKRRKTGRRVSEETAADRKLVYGHWIEYKEICRGSSRATFAGFAMYCEDNFDDMPTLDQDEIESMIKAHKKNPDPISREE